MIIKRLKDDQKYKSDIGMFKNFGKLVDKLIRDKIIVD